MAEVALNLLLDSMVLQITRNPSFGHPDPSLESATKFNIYFFFLAHNAVVTQSVFAPNPQLVFDQLEQNSGDLLNHQQQQQPADDSRSETKFNASSGNTSFKKDKSKDANKTNPGPGKFFFLLKIFFKNI